MPRVRHVRTASLAGAVLAGAALGAGLTGCVGDATGSGQPTLPTIDSRPKLVVEVDETGVRFAKGPREDASVTIDPPAVRGGTVVEVRNTGRGDHRVQAGTELDTGTLRPGEHTIVVVGNDTGTDKVLELTVHDQPDHRARLTVHPRTAA